MKPSIPVAVNLNDEVRFRIRPDAVRLFDGNPDIRIGEPGADGNVEAVAQLHGLILALSPHISPCFYCPISPTIEITRQVMCGGGRE